MGKLLDKARAASERGLKVVPTPEWDEDLLIKAEDIAPPTWERSETDDALDDALRRLGIVGAYERWCGKSEPKRRSRTEGIMVSCPMPDHPDEHPSAWLNSESNLGTCASCAPQSGATMFGFDITDLYAITHGYDVYSYKPGLFRQVRQEMALDLGLVVHTEGKTDTFVRPEELEAAPAPEPEEELATVTPITTPLDEDDDDSFSPYEPTGIDWRAILNDSSTFLKRWMERCSTDDLPEEFYFWLGLVALGAAAGRRARIPDSLDVKANLNVCLVGPSGLGKTRSMNRLKTLLQEAFPWKASAPELGGVRMISDPGSGEVLVDQFVAKSADPSDPPCPVNGLLTINELSNLMARSGRTNSTIKPMLMNFYDEWGPIITSSRTAGYAEARDHFCQVVSTTQPTALNRVLSRSDNYDGFMNRWVFAWGPAKEPDPFTALIDVSDLVPAIRGVEGWTKSGRRVTFDDDAKELFRTFFREKILPLKNPKNGQDNPIFQRLDLLLKKICLLFALDQRTEIVSSKIVEQATALWPYLLASYGYVEERTVMEAGTREQDDLQKRITNFLDREGPAGVDADRWAKQIERFKKRTGCGLKDIHAAWDILEQNDMVCARPDPRTGKKMRYLQKHAPLRRIRAEKDKLS